MPTKNLQSSLIEKGLLFCGYGGMVLSVLVGLISVVGGIVGFGLGNGGLAILFVPAALGFAAGVGLLALAEIIKYLRIIASASISETFK